MRYALFFFAGVWRAAGQLASSQAISSASSPSTQNYKYSIPLSLTFDYMTPILDENILTYEDSTSRLQFISASTGNIWTLVEFSSGNEIVGSKVPLPENSEPESTALFAMLDESTLHPPGTVYLNLEGAEIEMEEANVLVKNAFSSFPYTISIDGRGRILFPGNGIITDSSSGKTYYYGADDFTVYILDERESDIGDIDVDVCRFRSVDGDPRTYFEGSDTDNFFTSSLPYEQKWGLCRLDGTEIYPPVLEWGDYKNVSGGVVSYRGEHDLYGYINTTIGEVITDALYSPMWTSFSDGVVQEEYPTLFNEGLAPVRLGGLVGFINAQGEMVIEPQFDDTSYVYQNKAWVKQNGLWGQIEITL
ncbi:MAG: WG repeat-containing protein [Oscillospiraceae bacterium]